MVKLGISLRKRLHFCQDSSFNSLPLGRGFSTRILSLSNKHRDVKSCLVEFKLSTGLITGSDMVAFLLKTPVGVQID
ncbi:hypothetical protein VNO77_23634 [Canavalia gladiata]|uniref:Uncharacterized protein n=1 Tax=Canavalia gladiata TaxID=3824 RepID=A0AAN9Q943_CANGL